MSKRTLAQSVEIVYESHAPFMVEMILTDDGWNGCRSKDIFNAMKRGEYEIAGEILKDNGWKAEMVY